MLSVIMPANDEEDSIEETVTILNKVLTKEKIKHEILVINNASLDNTEKKLIELKKKIKELRYLNETRRGYGLSVIKGLENFKGDFVVIFMADYSDSLRDLLKYYYEAKKGYDCVFGSRFIKGGRTFDYPKHKLVLNRLGNYFIRRIFRIKYNDITNAFKLYRRETIEGLKPFISKQFNLTVELPLKAIIRGYSYKVIPNKWRNRSKGISKFKIKEMGSRYLFIIFYCLLEKLLSHEDYKKLKKNF